MKNAGLFSAVFTVWLGVGTAYATTPAELMTQAIRDGKASGELTGAIADDLRSRTHSTAQTFATFERMSIATDKCQFFKVTLTQSKIPDRGGRIVGDYVTVSKNQVCPDDREQAPPEVIDCHIGGVSCMPSKSSFAAPGSSAAQLHK